MFTSTKHTRISGIFSAVPSNFVNTLDLDSSLGFNPQKFQDQVGIKKRHITDTLCSSDLCYEAAHQLLNDLNWQRESIDFIVSISQTPDYPSPGNACLLQDRLMISNTVAAFDINLGCSSFPYGLMVLSSMVSCKPGSKGLLLIGDVSSRLCSPEDISLKGLFGDAGSAIAIEHDDSSDNTMHFSLQTNGAGYKDIYIPASGLSSRNPVSQDSLVSTEVSENISRNQHQMVMNGANVFSFAISKAPKSINEFMDFFSLQDSQIDNYVLHQANQKIQQFIIKKLKFDEIKFLSSIELFGNTSSVTIPLTISSKFKIGSRKNLICCGFGVGLSWGSCFISLDEEFITRPPLLVNENTTSIG